MGSIKICGCYRLHIYKGQIIAMSPTCNRLITNVMYKLFPFLKFFLNLINSKVRISIIFPFSVIIKLSIHCSLLYFLYGANNYLILNYQFRNLSCNIWTLWTLPLFLCYLDYFIPYLLRSNYISIFYPTFRLILINVIVTVTIIIIYIILIHTLVKTIIYAFSSHFRVYTLSPPVINRIIFW